MSRNKYYISMNENSVIENTAKAIEYMIDSIEITDDYNTANNISWKEMIAGYENDGIYSIFIYEMDGEPYISVYTNGDTYIDEAGMYVNDDGSLFYFDGYKHSFTIKFINHRIIIVCDDTQDTGLDGIYNLYQEWND